MKPLDSLTNEHRLIGLTLDALEEYGRRLEAGEAADVQDLRLFANFFNDFADLGHHVKEEEILFPRIVRNGFSWDSGPVQHVRSEHKQERYLVEVLRHAAEQETPWNSENKRHLLATIREFLDFQRQHIEKEEEILYPAIVERLGADDLRSLDQELAEFDANRFGAPEYARQRSIAEDLIARYARVHEAGVEPLGVA